MVSGFQNGCHPTARAFSFWRPGVDSPPPRVSRRISSTGATGGGMRRFDYGTVGRHPDDPGGHGRLLRGRHRPTRRRLRHGIPRRARGSGRRLQRQLQPRLDELLDRSLHGEHHGQQLHGLWHLGSASSSSAAASTGTSASSGESSSSTGTHSTGSTSSASTGSTHQSSSSSGSSSHSSTSSGSSRGSTSGATSTGSSSSSAAASSSGGIAEHELALQLHRGERDEQQLGPHGD